MSLRTFPWSDVVSVNAEWGLREESAEDCAARLRDMLQALEPLHHGFPLLTWTGGPMQPLYPARVHIDEFVPLFQPQRIYDQGRKRRVPDGFSLSADARLENKRIILLRISAGKHVDCDGQLPWPNSVSISTVVYDTQDADRPIMEALNPAFAAVVNAWRPDRARVFSRDLAAKAHDPARPSFYGGAWLVYLAPHLLQAANIPAGPVTKPSSNGGLLLWAPGGTLGHAGPTQSQVDQEPREPTTAAS